MQNQNKDNKKTDYIFILFILGLIVSISLFNFIVDPYYILRTSTIKGFNDSKPHKYSSTRTIIYSDMKINHKQKDTAFIGNCLLSHYGKGLENVVFYTIPMVRIQEVYNVINGIHEIAPKIETIYWGIFLDDLYNEVNNEETDTLKNFKNKNIQLDDFINLFFSWNTTKYSIDTVKSSILHKNDKTTFIYPYREIAPRTYTNDFGWDVMDRISNICKYAEDNNINLVIYYSPLHVSKKIHLYSKGVWDKNIEFKKKLSQITPFYDYSLNNQYSTMPLDENVENYIDNVHLTDDYNNLIVNDLLSNDKKIGILMTKENIDKYTEKDTKQLIEFMSSHKDMTEQIYNVKPEDVNVKIQKSSKDN